MTSTTLVSVNAQYKNTQSAMFVNRVNNEIILNYCKKTTSLNIIFEIILYHQFVLTKLT